MAEKYSLESVRNNGSGKHLPEKEMNMYHAGYEYQVMIPTRYGETKIYYFAPEKEGKYPLFIDMHGGGFVQGYRDRDILFARNIVENSGFCVISIDYHTAPEYKYPYAVHECYDVIKYVVAHAEDFHADVEKLVLAGHSAGGNLVAAAMFQALEQKSFMPKLLIIDYPPMDFSQDPEEQRYAYAPYMKVPVEKARKYNEWYIDKKYVREITASPVYAMKSELENFPPVVMLIAEEDSLAEGGVKFAAKLIDAGVTVYAKRIKGTQHGFLIGRRGNFEIGEKMIFESLEKVKKG